MKTRIALSIAFLVWCVYNPNSTFCALKILSTAALLNTQFEDRKQEYICSFNILNTYGFTPYIVDPCHSDNTKTFLDDYSPNVLYSHTNDFSLFNKGVNECWSMRAALDYFDFDDNDIILKLTGRYYFTSDYLIKIIESNPTIDAFVRWGGQPGDFVSQGHVFTGCFAMRCKHLRAMLKNMDYDGMVKNVLPVEEKVAEYILQHIEPEKVMSLQKIDVNAYVFGISRFTQW